MKNRYTYCIVSETTVIVEAESEEEAEQLAYDRFLWEVADFIDSTLLRVEEVK